MSHLTPSHTVSLANRPVRLRRTAQAVTTILVMVGLTLYGLLWLMQALPSQAQSLTQLNTIFYVTVDGTNADPCTQSEPCALQRAANLAADEDVIYVAGGTYQSNTLTPTLLINNKSITVTGGFNSSDWDAGSDPALRPTILDGGGNGRVVRIDGSASPIIEGFTIQNGTITNNDGAGVFISGGAPVIRNNIIAHNNTGSFIGAAIHIALNAHADVINNTIHNNNGITIISTQGTATIAYNIIHNNQGNNGTVRNFSGASMLVIGNLIYNNQVTNNGGGVYAQEDALIINNTIVGNNANNNGGGINIGIGEGTITIINNIVANNTGGGITGIRDNSSATIDGGYNNIFNNTYNVTLPQTTEVDPEFVNPANNNYRLQATSPNIDAGDPATDPNINIDLDGNARPNGTALTWVLMNFTRHSPTLRCCRPLSAPLKIEAQRPFTPTHSKTSARPSPTPTPSSVISTSPPGVSPVPIRLLI
jgi:hypothetical protein